MTQILKHDSVSAKAAYLDNREHRVWETNLELIFLLPRYVHYFPHH